MKLLPGTLVRDRGGAVRLEVQGAVVGLPPATAPPAARAAATTLPVVVGIRPEDVSVSLDADVQARVDVVEPLGRETLLHVVLDPPGVEPLRVLAPGQIDLGPGSRIGVRFARERLHFFDPTTEQHLAAEATT